MTACHASLIKGAFLNHRDELEIWAEQAPTGKKRNDIYQALNPVM